MEILDYIIAGFDKLFSHARLSAIVAGVLFSFGMTQWMKMPIRRYFYLRGKDMRDALSEQLALECHKWLTRTVAILSGAGSTFLVWPVADGDLKYRFIWAMTAGLSSPTIYFIVMHLVSKQWPWLADKVSADLVITKLESSDVVKKSD